jgi:hypothetical protein
MSVTGQFAEKCLDGANYPRTAIVPKRRFGIDMD